MESFTSIKSRKAQVWSLDIIFAGIIMSIAIVIIFIYAINYNDQSQENLNNLFYQGNLAAELILSEDNFGILSSEKVNQTKLNDFSNNYETKRIAMGISKQFYFEMEDLEVNGSPASEVGNKTVNTDSSVKITRVTIYKDKPTKFDLYIWE